MIGLRPVVSIVFTNHLLLLVIVCMEIKGGNLLFMTLFYDQNKTIACLLANARLVNN